jgi:hypothetical protein
VTVFPKHQCFHLVILVAVFTICGSLAAQTVPTPLETLFHRFDRNGDEKLTGDEAPPPRREAFDLNKDGVVTLEEARQAARGGARPGARPAPSPPTPAPAGAAATAKSEILSTLDVRYASITHPALVEDVAAALAWVQNHIAQHGGDPRRIFVTGHSAGAHLAGLVAMDERRLKKVGKDLSLLKGAILLDAAGYDLAAYLASPEATAGMTGLIHQTFGKNEAGWRDASPNTHVVLGKHIRRF